MQVHLFVPGILLLLLNADQSGGFDSAGCVSSCGPAFICARGHRHYLLHCTCPCSNTSDSLAACHCVRASVSAAPAVARAWMGA